MDQVVALPASANDEPDVRFEIAGVTALATLTFAVLHAAHSPMSLCLLASHHFFVFVRPSSTMAAWTCR